VTGTERLRVVFLLTLRPGARERFLAAYEAVRWQVAGTPGHLRDQVCQSLDEPDQWLITSEWVSAAAFLDWERTPEHRAVAAPMMACVAERRSLRFAVRASTPPEAPASARVPASAAARDERGAERVTAAGGTA
jgi:heme-degrading monooxygenase HmoA